MRSWQALTLNAILRLTIKRAGSRPINLALLRAASATPPKKSLAVPRGYRVESLITPGGLNFEVADLHDRAGPPDVLVLYLHGGGYIFGSPRTHRQVLIAMSRAFQSPAFGLFYRLAPEHPFPAAVDDARTAYQWLLSEYPGKRIVLAGDSAGAGLAIATALGARDAGLKRPAAIVGFSPYADLAFTGDSVVENARSCAMFTARGVREAAALYLGGTDPRHPLASPVYADLTGLPPMLLFTSRHEILRDDTLRLAERARSAGVSVELIVKDRLPHVWPVFVTLLPEAREAFEQVRGFAQSLASAHA